MIAWDRDEWKGFLEEAKTQMSCGANDNDKSSSLLKKWVAKIFYLLYSREIGCFKNVYINGLIHKRDEIENWRKVHNEQLHSLYCSPKFRPLKCAGDILASIDGMSILQRTLKKWVFIIMNWIELNWNREALVNVVLHLLVI